MTATRALSSIAIATGPATTLSAHEIAGVAAVNRDIRNLAVRDPLVSLDPTNGGAMSIAGQNNRFNRITVDGIELNGDLKNLEVGAFVVHQLHGVGRYKGLTKLPIRTGGPVEPVRGELREPRGRDLPYLGEEETEGLPGPQAEDVVN